MGLTIVGRVASLVSVFPVRGPVGTDARLCSTARGRLRTFTYGPQDFRLPARKPLAVPGCIDEARTVRRRRRSPLYGRLVMDQPLILGLRVIRYLLRALSTGCPDYMCWNMGGD